MSYDCSNLKTKVTAFLTKITDFDTKMATTSVAKEAAQRFSHMSDHLTINPVYRPVV